MRPASTRPFEPAGIVIELHLERRGPHGRALVPAPSRRHAVGASRHTRRPPPRAHAAKPARPSNSSATPNSPSTTGPAMRKPPASFAASTRRNAADQSRQHQQRRDQAEKRTHVIVAAPQMLDHQPVLRPCRVLRGLQATGRDTPPPPTAVLPAWRQNCGRSGTRRPCDSRAISLKAASAAVVLAFLENEDRHAAQAEAAGLCRRDRRSPPPSRRRYRRAHRPSRSPFAFSACARTLPIWVCAAAAVDAASSAVSSAAVSVTNFDERHSPKPRK